MTREMKNQKARNIVDRRMMVMNTTLKVVSVSIHVILKLINYSYGYKPIEAPHFGQVHVS